MLDKKLKRFMVFNLQVSLSLIMQKKKEKKIKLNLTEIIITHNLFFSSS